MTSIRKATIKSGGLALLFCAAATLPLQAQAPGFDNSNNKALTGTYYFRQTLHAISSSADSSGIYGDTIDSIVVYGNITFDGNGNYTIAGGTGGGLVADSGVGAPVPLSCYLAAEALGGTPCTSGSPVTGTYAVSQTGYAYLSNPVGPYLAEIEQENGITGNGNLVYGLVAANGVFSGSTTEPSLALADMFLAAPLSSPQPTNATFNGSYTVVGYLPPTGIGSSSPADAADVFFQMNADGAGNLGTVNITGYFGGGGTQTISQSSSNIKYFFSSGAAVVTFPTDSSATLLAGQEYFYFSPDGSFFFGGSPNFGYEMIVGVRNSGTQNFGGLYYEAGLDEDLSTTANDGNAPFDGYYGSFRTTAAGDIVAHDRVNNVFNNNAIGSTYADSFTPPVQASYTDQAASVQFAVGAGGAIRIGAGVWPLISVTVALQAPPFTPTQSVFLDPTGIVSAASFSPFTAGVSSGDFLTLYGTNLAASTVVSSQVPYPAMLGNVQVLVDGSIPAPIYYVSSGQMSIIMPTEATGSYATFQVINNGVPSNIVTMPLNQTTPGLFTVPNFNGLGYAAAVHNNTGALVTPTNPAVPCADASGQTCDYIDVFLTGLGSVVPAVPDGAAAPPLGPLSNVYPPNSISASVGGSQNPATVVFAGLAPGLAGLYQVNLSVPAGLASGDYTLDIGGPDSLATQALISVGTGPSAAVAGPTASARGRRRSSGKALASKPPVCRLGGARCGVREAPPVARSRAGQP
ncbi:MAG TPA: hypothetical protein VG297_25205 [Bryobacteraceae bacterium]|nr:hypothetical protein [Bryobacteraceae bacterium]